MMIKDYDFDECSSILDRLEEMCNMLGLHGMALGVQSLAGCLYNLYEENEALSDRVVELEQSIASHELEIICQTHIPD
jgi:hypothetical protein